MGVAIIGGSDGPTAIFVSSSINWFKVISIAATIIGIIIFCVLKHKKK
ncbi:MAG TPA: hypothetical protein PKI60_02195 [Oscillospiraceae bacterium]|nr:hypothetical protein [Oscillospiraceae bacterium]